ncbi:MAG: hypothetical protein DUW69_000586 [Verrucomicrobia bacterium]|jgi:hypothetical protein|nr:MAG: hypothetical protein DUW69_000586 [Verrucomicrobiota bacterium]
MRRPNLEQVLLGTALAAAVGSWVGYGWPGLQPGRPHRAFTGGAKVTSSYQPDVSAVRAAGPWHWLSPGAQSRGPEWTYDVFTPPEISYDEETRRFAVTPPPNPTGATAQSPDSGFEMVAVQREPCRLQLLGFVGDERSYRGAFENLQTNEVFLAGAGRAVPELGMVIVDFSVVLRPVKVGEGSIARQRVATAVVRDERTGVKTTLTDGARGYTGELRAILAETEDEDETLFALHRGEEFRSLDQTYIVDRLQLDPPLAELTQVSPDTKQPIRVRLTPRLSPESPSANPAN